MATIEITRSNRDRLNRLRRYPREPYRTIVRRLMDQSEDPPEPPLSPETIADIQASLDEIRRGRVCDARGVEAGSGGLSEVHAHLLEKSPA
ncbi:hypothetical protein [Methanoculleus chikugoensis]|uniref:hypothetical protein n=1 Tax=Methanoculleus chikugoensis TaxID=118126 RepID=UPI000B134071|nr:hypothetical protein [Methanoculleus chikugoensis]